MAEEKAILSPKAAAAVVTAVLSCGGGVSLMASHGSISSKLDESRRETQAQFEKAGEKLDVIKDEVGHLQGEVAAAGKTSTEAIAGLGLLVPRVNGLENDRAATHVRILELERRIAALEGKK